MDKVILTRFLSTPDAVFGVMHYGALPVACTIERPWLSNRKNISCIPVGVFTCTKYSGTRFKDVWKLNNVPGRGDILIHQGNFPADVEGCLAVGEYHFFDKPGVANSVKTLNRLRDILPKTFVLEIKGDQTWNSGPNLTLHPL